MKRTLILALVVVMSASVVFAQDGGHIALFSDPGYSDCNLVEPPAILGPPMNVYVVYSMATTTVRTAEFKLVKTGWDAFPGAETWSPNATVGTTYAGIVVSNPACQSTPWLMGTLGFFYDYTPQAPCTATLEVVGSPTSASTEIEGTFCDYSIHIATGGLLTINGNESCPCAVATEETNWSKIKALYQ